MGSLSAARIAEIKDQITKLKTRLTALEAAYLEASTGVDLYKLDTGQGAGSQMARRRRLGEIQEAIDSTQSRIDHLNAALRGTGLCNTVLRR